MTDRHAKLVSTAWLAEQLHAPDLRVIDATVHLDAGGIRSGREDYGREHVPGAVFLDLTTELSDREQEVPFMMPAPEQLDRVLSGAGLGMEHRAVVYSASHVMWATRLWWMLRASGFDRVSVLDGGLAKWKREERPLCDAPCSQPAAQFRSAPRPAFWADRDEVRAAIGDEDVCTLNALPRDVFTGESPVYYGRPGRIPDSANVPYDGTLDPKSGTFRPLDELRHVFRSSGALERPRVITYCGGGISATLAAFSLVLLGHPDVAVYDGSLLDWSRDPDLPLETGEPEEL